MYAPAAYLKPRLQNIALPRDHAGILFIGYPIECMARERLHVVLHP